MAESQDVWLQRQAVELLAQHIPFETDLMVKAELIEELRAIALRAGRAIDRARFGFEARLELQRLGLWDHFFDSTPRDLPRDDEVSYGHGRLYAEDDWAD